MENNEVNEIVMDFFKAFCNVERLKLAGLLANAALTTTQITERTGMSSKDVMKHVSYLVHFGYVKEIDKTYQLNTDTLLTRSRQVLEGSRPQSKVEDFEGDDFEQKVLRGCLAPDGHLVAIPSQQKKRMVVLRYLAQSFEPGVKYPEKQVNELLRRYHPDTASLRRYMDF